MTCTQDYTKTDVEIAAILTPMARMLVCPFCHAARLRLYRTGGFTWSLKSGRYDDLEGLRSGFCKRKSHPCQGQEK